MKPRERDIETAFCEAVEAAGGLVRKVRWLCRRGAPDRFYAFPNGRHGFVELKRPGEGLKGHQAREAGKLVVMRVNVLMIDTIEKIDAFIQEMQRG